MPILLKSKPNSFGVNPQRTGQNGGFQIVYQCPHCYERLSEELSEKERFCHNCGTPLDWGVVTYASPIISAKLLYSQGRTEDPVFEDVYANFEHVISTTNSKITDGLPKYMSDTSEEIESAKPLLESLRQDYESRIAAATASENKEKGNETK